MNDTTNNDTPNNDTTNNDTVNNDIVYNDAVYNDITNNDTANNDTVTSNDKTNGERHEQLLRVMAIVGFIVMIILLAWLAVQIVRFIPTAFSSLASVFEANQRELADKTTDDNVVVVDETNNDPNNGNDNNGSVIIVEADDDVLVPENTATSTPVTTPTDTTDTTPTPTDTTVVAKPVTPQYKTVVTYKVPVSDPNGYTDLATSFVAVGKLTSGERFVPSDAVEGGERAAMQFQVKNIGTKTSTDWFFVAEMANDNTMTSAVQLPLLPGEVTTLTIAFDAVDKTSYRFVGASVTGGDDSNLNNNGFRVRVAVR